MADFLRKRLREEDEEDLGTNKRCELSPTNNPTSVQAQYDQEVITAHQAIVQQQVIASSEVIAHVTNQSPRLSSAKQHNDSRAPQTPSHVQVDSQPTEDSQRGVEDDDDDCDPLDCSLDILLTKTPTQAAKPAPAKTRTPTPPSKHPVTIAAAAAAAKPIVSELEHHIKHEVPFPSKDFIIAKESKKYYPMVRITNITILNADIQKQLKNQPDLYFPNNGQLADNLYLQITPKGRPMDCWLVTPSCKLPFNDGKRPKPVLKAMTIPNTRPNLLRDAMQEADDMYERAVARERAKALELAREEEEAKQLKQTIVIEEDEAPVTAAAAAAVTVTERVVHPVEFHVGMQLEVERYARETTTNKIVEITPPNEAGELPVIRLDDDWCLGKKDYVVVVENDRNGRAYTLKDLFNAGSTFKVGSSGDETEMQREMRTMDEAKIRLQETAKKLFPDFASTMKKS